MIKLNYRNTLLFQYLGCWSWVEAVIVTMIFLSIAFYFNRADPLLLKAPFPWVWFAPVIISLRYGILPAAGSMIIIFIALFYFEPRAILLSIHYRVYMLGGVLLTVVCGEFHSAWDNSKRSYIRLNDYIRHRLNSLNRAFYMMKLSHDRLEKSLISRPLTLRGAINELRQLLSISPGVLSSEIASRFMHILEQYCSLDKASLYLFHHKKIEIDPIAYLGEKSKLDTKDVLVNAALKGEGIHYYGVNQMNQQEEQSRYLATIALRDDASNVLGLLAIEQMPFYALHDANLQTLVVLVSYLAESIWSTEGAKEFLRVYPDCPPQFGMELNNLLSLRKQLNIESALVAFSVRQGDRSDNIILGILHRLRGLDVSWFHKGKSRDILFILLPFSDPSAVEAFHHRFFDYLKEMFGILLGQEEVFLRFLQISSETSVQVVQKLLRHVNGE